MKKSAHRKNKHQTAVSKGEFGWKYLFQFLFMVPVILFFVFSFVLFVPQAHAAAGINRVINFQGKLVNKSDGTNISNGTYTFLFKIYNASSGGSQLWGGAGGESQSLTVTNGIFQASIGSVRSFATDSLDFNQDNLWLDITFNGENFGSRIQLASVPYALTAEKVSGLTVTQTTGTLTIANAKTLTANSTLTLAGVDSKTLTVNDSTTLGTNAITLAGGEVVTFTAANAVTFTTTGSTSVTLPTSGTLLGNTAAANQTITSTQTSGTVLGLTDSTAESAAVVGQSITLSGTGAFDQTGLQFNLSGASGTNLNDIVGTGSTWKVSKAGALTVASCSGCTGGVTLQTAYGGGSGITTTSGNDVALTLAAGLATSTKFSITNNHVSNVTDSYINNANASGTNTNGLFIEQTGAGTLTNGINITRTAGTLSNGLSFSGTIANDITTGTSNRNLTIAPNGTGIVAITSGATTSNGLTITSTGVTQGATFKITGGTAVTTGGDMDINGAVYIHTTAETGNLAKFTFTDNSTNTSGATVTNGLDVESAFTTSGAGTKSITGLNISAPTTQSCTTGACTWTGLKINTPAASANTTANGLLVTSNANVPAADMVSITNTGSSGVTVAGVNAFSIAYKGGAAAVEAGAMRVDLTPGGTTGGTWNGLRMVANTTGPATGVTETGVKVEGPTTGGSGTFNAINVINLLPATNGTVNGIQLATSAITQSAANTATVHGLFISTVGALNTNTAAGTINWDGQNFTAPAATVNFAGSTITENGLKVTTGNITQTAGTVAANGLNIALGSITTGGTQTGLTIAGSSSNAAGTENGINIGGITPGAAAENAINIGAGWDKGIAVATNATGQGIVVTAGGVPTADMVNITNAGQGITTAGVNGLSVTYVGGAAAVEAGAMRVDLTPGGTTGGTWNGLRMVANTTGPATGVTETGLKIEAPTSAYAGAFNGINFISPSTGPTTNGALTVLNISAITTPGAATERAISIGKGWDASLAFGAQSANDNTAQGVIQFASSGSGTSACATATAQGLVIKDQGGTQRGHFCFDSSNLEGFGLAWTASATDVAENYSDVTDSLQPGDLVSIDSSGPVKSVKKTSGPYDHLLFGIVSTQPGILLSDVDESNGATDLIHQKPIALTGRVPTHVSTENGSIAVGDYITSSSIPGVGMKATNAGPVIGQALEAYDGIGTGTIYVFTRQGFFNGTSLAASGLTNDSGLGQFIDASASAELTQTAGLTETIDTEIQKYLSGQNGLTAPQASDSSVFNNLSVLGLATVSADMRVKGNGFVEGMLTVIDTIMTKNILINGTSDLFGQVIFHSDVTFQKPPEFSNDTAGIAAIQKGTDHIDVVFVNKYPSAPVINATMVALTPSVDPQQTIFSKDYSYIITNITGNGFTIQLNKSADDNVTFSWTALSVSDGISSSTNSTAPEPTGSL